MLFIDSVSFLPMPLRKVPEAFGLDTTKSWYPHYFNKNTYLDYVWPNPDVPYLGVNETSVSQRREFMSWYDQKNKVFDNKLVLETYSQDDSTFFRQACQLFRQEFIEFGNIEIFFESFPLNPHVIRF